ncbi:MAG TPA: DUF3417 domain-containing protein, partial [Acidobacteriota bacterium]|nr:DUF3417 domain-containing protein [Acidobacteriota bacterium]
MKVEFADFPNLPERLSRLGEFAYNLWWSWNIDGRNLFRSLDLSLWRRTHHNPVQMLAELSREAFDRAVQDPEFLDLYDHVIDRFDDYMSSNNTWSSQTIRDVQQQQIAYLCAEFAVDTSLPIYSGGLGLLAGDTCKEASDLGLPFVAVGALYPEGYFRQWIEADGSQQAIYERMNTAFAPLLPVLCDDGSRFLVPVPVGEKEIYVAVWKVQVGRVPIYLMDTDIPENEPW